MQVAVAGGNIPSKGPERRRGGWSPGCLGEWCILRLERCSGVDHIRPPRLLQILLLILRAERNR